MRTFQLQKNHCTPNKKWKQHIEQHPADVPQKNSLFQTATYKKNLKVDWTGPDRYQYLLENKKNVFKIIQGIASHAYPDVQPLDWIFNDIHFHPN